MNQSDIVKRIAKICNEFDIRLATVGVEVARLELAKAFAECEARLRAEDGNGQGSGQTP